MTRRKYLYRVTATWADGTTRVRHFQSKQSADGSATAYRAGLPAIPGDGYDWEGKPAIPPALTVTVERSQPVQWTAPVPTWTQVYLPDTAVGALRLIAGTAPHCENSTTLGSACRQPTSGRARGAQCGADRWCDACVAAHALTALGVAL